MIHVHEEDFLIMVFLLANLEMKVACLTLVAKGQLQALIAQNGNGMGTLIGLLEIIRHALVAHIQIFLTAWSHLFNIRAERGTI